MQKPLVFVGQNEDACFCAVNVLEIDLGGVLGGKLTRKREPRQAKTGQDRPRQTKTRQDRTRQDFSGFLKPSWAWKREQRQAETGQDSPRQAKTGQDRREERGVE